jgi:serine/threonine protein kinase/beta-lactam-binding protein with PASTA domain
MDNNDKYIGQLLDNRYEILEKIGSGGMAVVYKARCHRLNRLVAVKILKDELAGDADFRRRFRTESQAVAMLSHPNIVAVYDVSRSGNIEYIVMELIEGITLKQYINRKGLLNWKEALHFSTQITKALSHAHSRGIIHRDIKPHNIMILKDGSVKVADFGIARLQSTQNTLTQEALGSVHYISPEQAKGSHVDARSDLYSVGVVMYEMLTSRLPFVGDSAVSIAIQHISAIPLMPRDINPDIPVGLETITMRAMEPDLSRRYASADELLADLEEFRKNPGIIFSDFSTSGKSLGNVSTDQATREIPSTAIAKAEGSLPRPVRTPRNAEMTREEYHRTSRRASKTATLVAIFSIIVFLVLVFVFMWNTIKGWINPPEVMVTIPNVVGQMLSDVSENPEYQQFDFIVSEEKYDETYEEGKIISQNPTADREKTLTEEKIEIQVVVSLGKEPVKTMPDLVNKDYREAKIELEGYKLNLKIETEPQFSDEFTAGQVMSTTPKAGEELIEGGTVYITYSNGPEVIPIKVPDVTGVSISSAQRVLQDYDLTWEIIPEESTTVEKNYVIRQTPEENEEVTEHTKIYLYVSSGPPAVETPSDSPTPSDEWPPPSDDTPPPDTSALPTETTVPSP